MRILLVFEFEVVSAASKDNNYFSAASMIICCPFEPKSWSDELEVKVVSEIINVHYSVLSIG